MNKLLTILFMCGAAFSQTKSTAAKSASVAKQAPVAAPNLMNPSSLKAIAPATYKAKFTTTQGDFVVQVTRAWAPLGADRFYNLVRVGYFNGVPFFRVIPGFMAQFGINGNPKINAVWTNANLKDDPVTQSNKRGLITFATAGPNTRTTQVFINYANNAGLDAQGFAPFGEVIEGMDVVDKFYSGYGGNPDQGSLMQLGQPWIATHMPKVDSVKNATIVPATPAAPATAKPAAPAKSATPAKQ